MKNLYLALGFLALLALTSCNSGTLWSNPSKNLTDLHVNDKECAAIALGKAKAQSLVEQPNIFVIDSAYFQCMQAYGWTPSGKTQTEKSAQSPLQVVQTKDSISILLEPLKIELAGQNKLISQNSNSVGFQLDDQTVFLYPQQITGFTIEKIFPPPPSESRLFSKHRTEKSKTTYYYQSVKNRSVFGCISYIWPKRNTRIIVSFTKVVPDIPEDFMQLKQSDFAELEQLEKRWTGMLADIEKQNSSLLF